MSRAWKPLPTHLPGWHQAERSEPIPESWWKKRSKGKHKSRSSVSRGRLSRKSKPIHSPFAPHTTPILKKVLHVEGQGVSAYCLFKREHGHWKCLAAGGPFEWFTRVHDMATIGDWLKRQHYEFHWIAFTPDTAYNCPAGPAQGAGAETCPAAPPSSVIPPTHAGPDGSVSGGLAQNGLTSPRCLIARGVPGPLTP